MFLQGYRTTLQINLDKLNHNMELIKSKARVPIMAVVKADAYGHGAIEIARELEGKVAFFCVACIDEGLELRMAGIKTPILILGATPYPRFEDAVENDIRVSVFEYEAACELSECAVKHNKTALFHIAVDTGMNRIGFKPTEENADICKKICSLPGIEAEGVFSHFATADSGDLTRTVRQDNKFSAFVDMLEEKGIVIPIKHMDNSAGILDFERHYDMVRSGIITYGLYPSEEIEKSIDGLVPVLRWESYVSYIKEVGAGEEVSYGGLYVTDKKTSIATVPVGYADGYPRCLSGRFHVLINGRKAPIIGRICMDQLMVDVSGIPDCKKNDKVTLIGWNGDEFIGVDEIAKAADSFNYEFVCGISRRVTRIYFKDKQVYRFVNYLTDDIRA